MPDRRKPLSMEEWEAERLGRPADELTVREVEARLPRRDDLRRPPFLNRLGGRVRHRLRPWPDKARAADLSRRAKKFLAQTPRDDS